MRPVLLGVLALLLPLAPLSGTQADHGWDAPDVEMAIEGHTVFHVIPAAPAVLAPLTSSIDGAGALRGVAEADPAAQDAALHVHRYPGVLWMNDQYLVGPSLETYDGLGGGTIMHATYGAAVAVLAREERAAGAREPCGGAVVAWPHAAELGDARWYFDDEVHTPWLPATSDFYAYAGSSRVTDPNGRVFVTDAYLVARYDGFLPPVWVPVWAQNVLGGEAFVPDVALPPIDALDCALAADLAPPGFGCDTGVAPQGVDHPCAGFRDPGLQDICYHGHVADAETTTSTCADLPARRYNGLLYLDWDLLPDDMAVSFAAEHCTDWWAAPDPSRPSEVCDPRNTLDAAACAWGTEWACPDDGWGAQPWHDLREGNSHSYHPGTPHEHAESLCDAAWGSWVSPVNHGGSVLGASGPCDYFHAGTELVVRHYADWRPPPPAVRTYVIDDLVGATAPFMDFHQAFPLVG